jgi:hypothetical protein
MMPKITRFTSTTAQIATGAGKLSALAQWKPGAVNTASFVHGRQMPFGMLAPLA